MSADHLVLVQAGTAGIAALTAVINLSAIFFRRKVDPTQLQVIDDRAKEMAASNKRVTKLLSRANGEMLTQLTALNGKLGQLQGSVDKIKQGG